MNALRGKSDLVDSVAYYEEHASELFEKYRSVSFSEVHSDLVSLLPEVGARVLDVGAGSGRDAMALAHAGYVVTAVEPSEQLRLRAQTDSADLSIRWLDDRLPQLRLVVAERLKYDFILLSAVWMHIAPEDRIQAMEVLASLLSRDGKLAISLRMGSAGSGDRRFFTTSRDEILVTALAAGLRPVLSHGQTTDALGRPEVIWDKVVLARYAP